MFGIWIPKTILQRCPTLDRPKKIANVSSREAYLRDHHRNLFGNDKQAFFKKDKVDYTTTQRGNFNEKNLDSSGVVVAGGAGGAQL